MMINNEILLLCTLKIPHDKRKFEEEPKSGGGAHLKCKHILISIRTIDEQWTNDNQI